MKRSVSIFSLAVRKINNNVIGTHILSQTPAAEYRSQLL